MRRAPLELYARPGIDTVAGLRGRTVAGNAAVASNFMLRMVLAGEGVSDGAWTPLETGGALARVRALVDGRPFGVNGRRLRRRPSAPSC